MDLRKFRDLVASEELYFRRGLNPYDIRDRGELNNHLGSLAQHRESYYISCWYLFCQETLDMWEQYGHDGVAVTVTPSAPYTVTWRRSVPLRDA